MPEDPRLNLALDDALARFARGEWEAGETALQRLHTENPASIPVAGHLAHQLYNKGELRAARRVYLRLLKHHPLHGPAWLRLLVVCHSALRRRHAAHGRLRRGQLHTARLATRILETLLRGSGNRRYRALVGEPAVGERFGIAAQLDALRTLGGAYFTNGVLYTRVIELPLALNWLGVQPGQHVLDIGSPGSPAALLLAQRGVHVTAFDLETGLLAQQQNTFRPHAPAVQYLTGDARRLPLADASLDRVLAVSTLEHIPGDGDSAAMAEIGRVLRPGGRAFVSLYGGKTFREDWVRQPIGHAYRDADEPCLVRSYDPGALRERIVLPSGLLVIHELWLGETTDLGALGFGGDPAWQPRPCASALTPLLALAWCKPVDPARDTPRWQLPCLLLEKPAG